MNKMFRIEIVGDLPDADPDLGAHAHVAAVRPVAELVKTLTDMGVLNLTKHIRVLKVKAPANTAKLAIVHKGPEAA